eukprot:6324652-Pyramimonas_sp.AAC.1
MVTMTMVKTTNDGGCDEGGDGDDADDDGAAPSSSRSPGTHITVETGLECEVSVSRSPSHEL